MDSKLSAVSFELTAGQTLWANRYRAEKEGERMRAGMP